MMYLTVASALIIILIYYLFKKYKNSSDEISFRRISFLILYISLCVVAFILIFISLFK